MTEPHKTKGVKKLSPDDMAKAIHTKHDEVVDAVHSVLQKAGLRGVTVHSLNFSVAPEMMTGSPCSPPCQPGQSCVASGGRWICVPQPIDAAVSGTV